MVQHFASYCSFPFLLDDVNQRVWVISWEKGVFVSYVSSSSPWLHSFATCAFINYSLLRQCLSGFIALRWLTVAHPLKEQRQRFPKQMLRLTEARPECSCISDDVSNEFDTCFIEYYKYTGRAHVSFDICIELVLELTFICVFI